MTGNKALICIPDITGFTEYISESSLATSKRVIPALLNKLVYANSLDLKLSEIEGDAVLFFRIGEPPSLKNLLDQCRIFFKDFYSQMRVLEKTYRKQDEISNLSSMLGLKVILHYGNIDMMEVGKRLKLIGEDVIAAHRLLKNSIPDDEYVMLTDALIAHYQSELTEEIISELNFKEGFDTYTHIGRVNYMYAPYIEESFEDLAV